MSAPQTTTTLSITHFPADMFESIDIGMGPWSMLNTCFNVPITRSTCMRTCAILRVFSISNGHNCFFPLVNAGITRFALNVLNASLY